MSTRIFHGAAAICLLLTAAPTGVAGAEKVAAYDTFRLVRTRNMFDPNRRPLRVDASAAQRAAAPGTQNHYSLLSLTGTMVTERKVLAFFAGTRADFSRVLSVGDTIADYKITGIKPAEVAMERAGKPTVLPVGRQLEIEGVPSDLPASAAPANAPAGKPGDAPALAPAAPMSADPSGPSVPPDDKSEVLRRMMERRAKELSK